MEILEREKQFSREIRAKNDIETLFAECLDGSMRTPFEYQYDSQADKLYAQDGSDVDEIFDNSLAHTKTKVAENPNLGFELRRQQIESVERDEMKAMMRGELPNTIVVVSDFPEELHDYPSNYHGYNVTRKQAMLRILTRKDNKLHMFTQTLDGSNRKALESIYAHLGFEAKAGELLGQRINVDVDAGRQKLLVDELMNVYDSSLSLQFAKKYHAGIEVSGNITFTNTYDFVKSQTDLVGLAVAEVLNWKFDEEKQYQTIALLQKRFLENTTIMPLQYNNRDFNPGSLSIRIAMLEQERIIAGIEAGAQGKTYTACGLTLSAKQKTAEEEIADAGYAGVESGEVESSEDEKWSYNKKAYCVSCQAPPAKGDEKKMCGPCSICKDCVDTKFGGKK